MAEALEDGIHETGVAVVPQADHTRYRVRWPNEPIGRRWRWNTISALLVARKTDVCHLLCNAIDELLHREAPKYLLLPSIGLGALHFGCIGANSPSTSSQYPSSTTVDGILFRGHDACIRHRSSSGLFHDRFPARRLTRNRLERIPRHREGPLQFGPLPLWLLLAIIDSGGGGIAGNFLTSATTAAAAVGVVFRILHISSLMKHYFFTPPIMARPSGQEQRPREDT